MHTHLEQRAARQMRRPGSSWGFGALLKGLTSVVDNSCQSRDSNPQPRVTSLTLYPLEPRLPPINYQRFSNRFWNIKIARKLNQFMIRDTYVRAFRGNNINTCGANQVQCMAMYMSWKINMLLLIKTIKDRHEL